MEGFGSPTAWAGWGVAIITGLFAWIAQKTRGKTEETVAVMGQWRALLDAHKESAAAEVRALKDRVNELEKDLADLRRTTSQRAADTERRHSEELAERDRRHEAEMRAMREMNEGLQRQIIQASRSTGQLLGNPLDLTETETAKRLKKDRDS